MLRAVLVVGYVFLFASGLAACSSSGSGLTPSTTPSPTATFTTPTRTFSSAALGVSFRYPAGWQAMTPGVVVKGDDGTAGFRGPSGEVGVTVAFVRAAEHASPYPVGNADSSDLAEQRSSTGNKIQYSGLVTMDGLRLVEIESIGRAATGQVSWHFVQLSSAGMGGNLNALRTSLLEVYVACPASQWLAQRTTLLAVLASMRFTRPKG